MSRPINLQEQVEQMLRNGAPIIFTKRTWVQRLFVVPFETCFMLFCMWCGFAGLLNIGTSSVLFNLASESSDIYNALLTVSASSILYGAATRSPKLEAAGLIVLIGQLITRAIILGMFASEIGVNTIVMFSMMAVAAMVRFAGVMRKPHVKIEVLQ